ncbi:hypothetical protein ACLX1H_003427 [Fusarium chlamydosporum]
MSGAGTSGSEQLNRLSPYSPNTALNTILDRLQRLEAQTVAGTSQANGQSIPTPSVGGSEASSPPVALSTVNGRESSAFTPHNVGHEMDAMTVLKDAVDHVQKLRKRSFGPSVITASIDIPTDLAKTWVANFFQHMPILSLYLSIYMFVASSHTFLFQSRLAAEFFDYDLAWKSFKYACEYCQVLNLHRLDSDENNSFFSDATCDDERRGFWEVIQIDLFYRLILNTPPAITNNPWKVNLPWLDLDSGAVPQGMQTITFLASSRVSLVIARFFAMLDDPANATKTEIVAKTEDLCREMQQIFAEWQLNEWLEAAQDNEQDIWVVADVILTGYTSIIYMFRKMALLNSNSPRPPTTDLDIPDSPIVEDAARRLIGALNRLLVIYPYG